jgi:glycosyltransferase involved in cell wall biosynthesis
LKSQQGCSVEIIVVEQSWEPLLHEKSIEGVRYLHARSTCEKMAFNKSWALNVGARHARSDILIFHDGDMLAPESYASAVCEIVDRGYQAARIPRLVFYPSRADSEFIQREFRLDAVNKVANVRQNCRGISLAITKDAYWAIGGHDESFYGWGGEDDEILQRVQTLRMYSGGFLPFVHLWHAWQIEKYSHMKMRKSFSIEKLQTPVAERIVALCAKQCGSMESPVFEEPDW